MRLKYRQYFHNKNCVHLSTSLKTGLADCSFIALIYNDVIAVGFGSCTYKGMTLYTNPSKPPRPSLALTPIANITCPPKKQV